MTLIFFHSSLKLGWILKKHEIVGFKLMILFYGIFFLINLFDEREILKFSKVFAFHFFFKSCFSPENNYLNKL